MIRCILAICGLIAADQAVKWYTVSHLTLGETSYPVFNVADIFVVDVVILFLLYYLFLYEKTDGKKNRSKPDDRKGAQD